MYILEKTLSLRLKKKKRKCMHSFPGLQKQALGIESPKSVEQAILTHKIVLSQTH